MKRLPLFEEKSEIILLRSHIEDIARVVSSQVNAASQPGWMTGLAGMAVFLGEYEVWAEHDDGQPEYGLASCGILEKIVESINDGFSFPTLAAGLTGIVWAFRYLGERKLIDSEDAHVLDELLPFLRTYGEHEISVGNLDALHGGIGPYVLGLLEGTGPVGTGADLFRSSKGELDLGLAHGLPSYIFYLCTQISKNGTGHPDEGRDLMAECFRKLISYADFTHKYESVFPTRLTKGIPQYPSRMAWCYGDVGIAMGLIRCAHVIQGIEEIGDLHDQMLNLAERVLIVATDRRDPQSTRIEDPYFCHGTSGLAFMFYKAWVLSKNDKLKEAAQFWTKETIRFLESSHPVGRVYDREGVKFGNGSLLNGLSGIGLSLMAIEKGEIQGWETGLLI